MSWRREGVRGDDLVGHIKVLRRSEACPDPVLFYTYFNGPRNKTCGYKQKYDDQVFHKCWYFDFNV